jgi:uncharacterized membrane protein HdeD (DUF308 family)
LTERRETDAGVLGYMVVAYGVARLLQTIFEAESKNNAVQVVAGVVGIAALAILAFMLHDQAEQVGAIGGL